MSLCRASLIAFSLFAAAAGCSTNVPQDPRLPPDQPAPPPQQPSQPSPAAAPGPGSAIAPALAVAPSDDRLGGVLWTQTSAEYRVLALATFARARIELDRALADPTWTAALEQQSGFSGLPPAVIADVDETLLDNTPYEADRIRVGGRYEPVSWGAWVNRASAAPVPGALEFARYAAERGVTVFYVTNRAAPLEESTRANLEAVGFPLVAGRDTLLVPGERPDWGSEKSVRRAEVAREFRILLLVGDDLGDFVSGARSAPEERVALAERYAERWQRSWILLPNPYYGSWERALLGNERDLAAEEVLRRKLARLRGSGFEAVDEPGDPGSRVNP
jgi:5'-nucleotidase (lipoprotein e(P4) family)